MEIFERLIQNTSEYELNLIVFLFSFLEYLLPVVPGDIALAFGVFMAVYGGHSAAIIFGTSTAGGTMGALVSLMLGAFVSRKYDQSKLLRFLEKFTANSEDKLHRATELINRYGLLIIITNRFIPVLRGPIVFAAGYSGVSLIKALSGAVISALLFNLVITAVSFLAGKNFEIIKSFLSYYFQGFIILVIILFITYKLITRFAGRKR